MLSCMPILIFCLFIYLFILFSPTDGHQLSWENQVPALNKKDCYSRLQNFVRDNHDFTEPCPFRSHCNFQWRDRTLRTCFNLTGLSLTSILKIVFTITGLALASILLFIGVRYCKYRNKRPAKWYVYTLFFFCCFPFRT